MAFTSGQTEYEYTLDALTGEIISFETETQAGPSAGQYIGEDAAKSIALSRAGLTENAVTGLKVTMERDDGRVEYEVEFRVGSTKYECSVDAVNGEVVEYEVDTD